MKSQEILIAHPQTIEQLTALKAFMQALKIKFEISKSDDYNPDFVAKIEASLKEVENSDVKRVFKEKLKEFLGL